MESEESEPTPTTQYPSISTHEESDELLSEDDDHFLLTLEDTAAEETPAPTSAKALRLQEEKATEKSELVPTGDEGLDNKKEQGTSQGRPQRGGKYTHQGREAKHARDDHDEVESTPIKEKKQNTRSTPSRLGGCVRSFKRSLAHVPSSGYGQVSPTGSNRKLNPDIRVERKVLTIEEVSFKSSGGSSRSLSHVRSSGYGQVSPSEYAPNGSNRKLNTGLRVERKVLTFEEVKARNEKRHNHVRSTGYGKLSPTEYNGGYNRSLNGGSNRSLNAGDRRVVTWY